MRKAESGERKRDGGETMKMRYLTVGKGKTKMKKIVGVVLKINTEGQRKLFMESEEGGRG